MLDNHSTSMGPSEIVDNLGDVIAVEPTAPGRGRHLIWGSIINIKKVSL